MTNYLVFEGKTVEKAVEAAAKELSRDMTALEYDIISYGSSGIFGLVGAKKAKIKVLANREDEPARFKNDARLEARNLVKDAFNVTADTDSADEVLETETISGDLTKAIEVGTQALQKIVSALTEGAQIDVESSSDRLLFKIDGDSSAVLIGKKGHTLDAMQYLVEKIINKQTNARIRVLVDVKGYQGNRKDSLKKLALRLAEKAEKSNKPVTVGQMNAHDRRIVHITLKDNPDIRTQSIGDGYYRKLVIFPKKKKSRKNQDTE